VHWYGFYHGPTFYWTRYNTGHWWWYHQGFGRWVYWYQGFWWWPSPTGVQYVYVDNNYYPYESGVVTVKSPEVSAPPMADPGTETASAATPGARSGGIMISSSAPEPPAQVEAEALTASASAPAIPDVVSPDGDLLVKVMGAQHDAFLYEKTEGVPVLLRYLGGDVAQARFTKGSDGKGLKVLLDFKDGSFAVYDSGGNPVDAPNISLKDEPPGPPPEALPPPPSDQGQ